MTKLKKALLEILEINESGYAGILPNGNIVSRLEYPEAVPVQENELLGIPKPKVLGTDRETDWCCVECGVYFLTPEQLEDAGVHTAHTGNCCVCGKEDMVLHIRNYRWLYHYKYKPKKEKK